MRKEVTVAAKTIELAVENGVKKLGVQKEDVTYEVIELPKKGIFGFGGADAKVKVIYEMSAKDTAIEFILKMISHMGINAKPIVVKETKNELQIDIEGEGLGVLIGYHGEILDSLQYLTYLAVNKVEDEDSEVTGTDGKSGTIRIMIDVENYRKKREETLKSLAMKMADRVFKYRRSITLEPMTSYERRIIHSTIQDVEGITTYSIGQDTDRRIVISRDGGSNAGLNRNSGTKISKPGFKTEANFGVRYAPKPYNSFSGKKDGAKGFKPYSNSEAKIKNEQL